MKSESVTTTIRANPKTIDLVKKIQEKEGYTTMNAVWTAAVNSYARTLGVGTDAVDTDNPTDVAAALDGVEYLNTDQAADFLGWNSQYLRRVSKAGVIRRIKRDSKSYVYRRDDLIAYQKSLNAPADDE